MFTVAIVVWSLAFVISAIVDPGQMDGSSYGGFLIIEVPAALIWIRLFRATRRPRLAGDRRPTRGWRARTEYFLRSKLQRAPAGEHDLRVNPTGARTQLTRWDVLAAGILSGAKGKAEAEVGFVDSGRRVRLDRAEQVLGNALYQLDLRRGSHELSKEQISTLRVTGVVAGAWLSTQSDLASGGVFGTRASPRLEEGIQLLIDLAQQAQDFLLGKVGADRLEAARDRLVRLVD
ncbi:MAG TPA: hypothetical protein VJ914_23240 [Pseudonocardiaceae bacterium]|nr:hypothetical protein [Pseudonocardiaceae bacterium]